MANDSSLVPTTSNPPGQATLYTAEKTVAIAGATGPGVVSSGGGSVTTTDIEFDYSSHLDRIVTALEQISLSLAFVADKMDNVSDKLSNISENSDIITNKLSNISGNSDIIADKQTAIETYHKKLKELGEGDGIHAIGPYEYLGLINVYKTLVEEGDILKTNTIQKSATKVAALRITEYLNIIKNLPKQF
jgi:hypothetical protein